MKKYMKEYMKELIIGGITALVIVPLVIVFIINTELILTDTTNEWIGFWGGYLGSLISGGITLYVLFKTLSENQKEVKAQRDSDFKLMELEIRIQQCEGILKDIIEFERLVPIFTNVSQNFIKDLIKGSFIQKNRDSSTDTYNHIHSLYILINVKLKSTKYTKSNIVINEIDLLRKTLEIYKVDSYDGQNVEKEMLEAVNQGKLMADGNKVLFKKMNNFTELLQNFFTENMSMRE